MICHIDRSIFLCYHIENMCIGLFKEDCLAMDEGSGDSCGDYNSKLLELDYIGLLEGIPVVI